MYRVIHILVALSSIMWLVPSGLLSAENSSMDLEEQTRQLRRENRVLLEKVEQFENQFSKKRRASSADQSGRAERPCPVCGRIHGPEVIHPGYVRHHHLKYKTDQYYALFRQINERVTLSGLLEVEASMSDGYDVSDVTLATVELGLDVEPAEWVNGRFVLLWEEDDTEPVDLDEAVVTIGDTRKFPFYLSAGRMYVPFGFFETYMIQDSLSLELAETRESAVQLGLEFSSFYASIYMFNGDIRESGDDDLINSFGANLGCAFESDDTAVDVGVGWINNISDSGGLRDVLAGEIDEHVGGFSAHAFLKYGPFSVIAEYVGALCRYDDGEFDFHDRGARPSAWNVEGAYSLNVLGREATFAVGLQKSDEAVAMGLAAERIGTAVGLAIFDNTTLALEYIHDRDYDDVDGGSGGVSHQVTLQVAVEF